MNHKSLFSNFLSFFLFFSSIAVVFLASFSLHQHHCNNWTENKRTENEEKENYSFLCLINQLFTYYVCLKSWVQSKENSTTKKKPRKTFPFFTSFCSFGVDFTSLLKKRFSLIFFYYWISFCIFLAVFFHFFVEMWNGSLITYITSDYKQSRISAQQTFMEAMVQWSCHQGNKANKIISNYSLVYLFWIAYRHWDYIWDDFLNWYHFISI